MSTPFICRRCIARLTQFHARQTISRHFQIHTHALSSPIQEQAWGSLAQGSEPPAEPDHIPSSHLPQPPTSHPGPFVSQFPGYNSGKGREPRLRKFIPRRYVDAALRANIHRPTALRRFKLKVLKSRGNFIFIRDEIAYFYGLSNQRARYAVNQLGRLLGGRASGEEAGEELDRYHVWKRSFSKLLKRMKDTQTTPNDGNDPIQADDRMETTKQPWEVFRGEWSELSNDRRKSLWRDYITSMFQSAPEEVPDFIQKTFQPEWCSNYVVEDSLYLILRSLESIQDDKKRRKQVVDLIFFLLQKSPPRYLVLDQWSIWKAVCLIPTSRAFKFYHTLKMLEHPLRQNTLLHFASCLAVKSKYKAQAVEILRFLSSTPGFDINTPAPSSVCTTLLTMKEWDVVTEDHAAPDELFRSLLDVGYRPSLLGLSSLMRNFCLRERVDVAWRIFNSLLETGIEPDAHVFSILLNGSKNILDGESVQRDLDLIETAEGWTPVLLNDFLDYIYQVAESQEEQRRAQRKRLNLRAWRLMLQVYNKFFHRAQLQKLTRVPLARVVARHQDDTPHPHLGEIAQMVAGLRQRPDDSLMEPDSITIEIMLRAYFRSIDEPALLLRCYKDFLLFFRIGSPILVRLIEDRGSTVYDIFLRDLLQFKETFNEGVSMVNWLAGHAKMEKRQHGDNKLHPPPSPNTYAILMNGYRNHWKYEEVVRTLERMIEEGITPNMVHWSTVIGSLLEGGSVIRAARVIEHLNQLGLQPDHRTINEITRISLEKRKKLAEHMAIAQEHPRTMTTPRFIRWILRLWRKQEDKKPKEPQMSLKEARQINALYGNIDGENRQSNAGWGEKEDDSKVEKKPKNGSTDMGVL